MTIIVPNAMNTMCQTHKKIAFHNNCALFITRRNGININIHPSSQDCMVSYNLEDQLGDKLSSL